MAIHRNSLIHMQRIQQAVVNGYFYYVPGMIDLHKFDMLDSKFSLKYGTSISKQARCRRKRAGEAVTVLHAVMRADQQVHFVLMCTTGIGRVHTLENLFDLRNKHTRLVTSDGRFEIVHDGKSWSWSMTNSYYKKFQERIRIAAALPPDRRKVIIVDDIERDRYAERILDELYSLPGFRLIRRQVGGLVTLLTREWKRLRPETGPVPSKYECRVNNVPLERT